MSPKFVMSQVVAQRIIAFAALALLAGACSEDGVQGQGPAEDASFTLIMLPDTGSAVDFTHQTAEGFVIDGSDMFLEQMRYIAGRAESNGGDVAFVASVGDVWQHVTDYRDDEHEARGVTALRDAELGFEHFIDPVGTLRFELPLVTNGFQMLAQAQMPFGVAPGNHDYDAWWATPIPGRSGATTHIGGLNNFRSVFGSRSDFFAGKSWYVDSFDGGANSAQMFSAGGYRFLHLALEMHPGDDVIAWAWDVLARFRDWPTIVTTHDFLNPDGERLPAGMDLADIDPEAHSSPEGLWRSLISPSRQIFLVLSGHQPGQAFRTDLNEGGHEVYQVMADYQDRALAVIDADPSLAHDDVPGIGDGWLRELRFELGGRSPHIEVRTYSTHYKAYASEMPQYAAWYRTAEQPGMTEAEFLSAEEFRIPLPDFRQRFGAPQTDSD